MAKSLIKDADRQAAKDLQEARTWKRELQLAEKREKDWLKTADAIVKRYRGEERKKNRFNVLWSNTEILRPAIFNTKPTPDVRRRFRDADPLGKAVSEVLERALHVHIDGYDTECAAKNDVLDALLGGRGLSVIRYMPSIVKDQVEAHEVSAGEIETEVGESIEYEQVVREHVDYHDFRHGYGRVWNEVTWEGIRHKMTRAEANEKFGEAALVKVKFARPASDDKEERGEEVSETSKIAEFWEIWDKTGKRVFFTQENAEALLYPLANPDGAPPIAFPDFYPNPEPLKIIENTGSTLPIPHFHLYEEQANELDAISARIDRIVKQMKLRGVYDSKLSEMSDLMSADDNELTPVQNAQGWAVNGGLDKAISWMPVDQAVKILEGLYQAREKQKAIIDELTGISDIVRGVTDANETAAAQQLKSNYHSARLQRMQREVQRYERDMLRCAAAVVPKFGPDTLAQMTDLKFPTAQEKQQLQAQAQRAQSQAQMQPGQPPPPDPALLQIPSWDEIMGLMQSSSMRQYRIDIETDSTIAATLDSDMQGMVEVMTGVGKLLEAVAPMVQSQALPIDAAKELVMSVIRRARLGMAVEDAFDKMKAPAPQPPPPDHSLEVAKIKAQSDQQIAQMKIQAEAQQTQVEHQTIANTEAAKANVDAQRVSAETGMKMQLESQAKEHEAALEQLKIQSENERKAHELEVQRMIADADNQTKVLIAQITAQHQADMQSQQQAHEGQMTQVKGEQEAQSQDKQFKHEKSQAEAPTVAAYEQVEKGLKPVMEELIQHLSKPKRVMRDEAGKIVGVQ